MSADLAIDKVFTAFSMTVSYGSTDIRRAEIVHLANSLLRHRFGYKLKSRSIGGPTFYAKAVVQKLMRKSGWVKRERMVRRGVDFWLDANHPSKIVDLPNVA